jgi:hypothetical protein
MQIDTKAAAIVIGTLLLGTALGAVGVGALARQRNAQVQELRQPRGFVEHMEEVIAPRDAAQRDAIRPFLEATARRNDTIIRAAHEQLRNALDSLRVHLAPMLNADQQARLEREGRLPDPFPPRRDGPPPEAGRGNPPPRDGPPPPRRGDGPPPRGDRPPPDGGRGGPPGGGT